MPQHCHIVIPAFNCEKFLAATVESIRIQSFRDWTLLIVDDGSTDSTAALAESLAAPDERIRVIHQANGGLANARNVGLANADAASSRVLFIDADDLLLDGALQSLSATLDANPDAPACHGRRTFIDSDGQPTPGPTGLSQERFVLDDASSPPRLLRDNEPTPAAAFAAANFIWSTGQVLIRRDAPALIAGFDTGFSGVADWDMWYRLACGAPLAYLPRPVMAYRLHSTSMSRNRNVMRRAEAAMRLKQLQQAATPDQYRMLIRGQRHVDKTMRRQLQSQLGPVFRAGNWRTIVRTLMLWAYTLIKSWAPVRWSLWLATRR